jgi:hypothetical protein
MFCYPSDISIFIPLAFPWGPNLDPGSKSVILAGARKNHIKVVYVFYQSDTSHFHSIGCPLGFQFGSLQQKCDPDRRAQNSHKSLLCVFCPSGISNFHSFGCPLMSQFESLLQKRAPDRRAQNSNKSRLCFLYPSDTFHFHSLACPLGS